MLRAADIIRVRLPLRAAFRTARGVVATKDALIVRVQTDDGEGWGECVAQSDPSYLPDTIATARTVLRDHLLPRAFAGAPFDDVQGHPTARAALECALLDARLRAEGVSLATHLGATRRQVPAGVAAGLPDDTTTTGTDHLRAEVQAYAEAGYRRIKCKIQPGRDLDVIRAVRAEVGDEIQLAADANGSYTPEDLDTLVALDDLGLQCIEQPFERERLGDHARLAAQLRTPVCLDESITGAARARDAIVMGACDMVSIKSGRIGGFAAARAVHDCCTETGTPALAGGMLETGLGRAALVAVAALPGCTETGDCSASERYFGPDGDLTEPFSLRDGHLTVPDGPGLGVNVRPDRLAACTIARERVTPR